MAKSNGFFPLESLFRELTQPGNLFQYLFAAVPCLHPHFVSTKRTEKLLLKLPD